MEFKDYYKILGVKADADGKEIKSAYRKLARKYHPDVNPEKGSGEQFKEVAEAYEVLKKAERRAEYDELRRYSSGAGNGFQPPPGWRSSSDAERYADFGAGQDFSEFFNSIFSGRGDESHSRDGHHHFGLRGQDVEIEMPIFLEDTLADESKKVEYFIPVTEGKRLSQIKKSLKVKIPLGVMDGERIRLKGQGTPGQGNAPSGDLYLHIRLVPHPLFDVQGHNLLLTVPLTPWEAALGTKVTVPTLQGQISLTIAPNSQTGKKLRIKGRGLKSRTGSGDLYAILKVMMPTTSNDKTKQLWKELADSANFDPRAEWSNGQ